MLRNIAGRNDNLGYRNAIVRNEHDLDELLGHPGAVTLIKSPISLSPFIFFPIMQISFMSDLPEDSVGSAFPAKINTRETTECFSLGVNFLIVKYLCIILEE